MKSKVIPKIFNANKSLYYTKNSKNEDYSVISFSGIQNKAEILSNKLQYKKLCSKEQFLSMLDMLEPTYKEYFKEISENIRREIDINPNLFKNMPDEIKAYIQKGHIIGFPQKAFMGRAIDAITAPINFFVKSVKNLFTNKEKLTEIKKLEQLKTDFASIEGFIEYSKTLEGKNPQEAKMLLQKKIKSNFIKVKANYSSNISTTLTEIASMLVATIYHGLDFYNITRSVDDNHDAAMKEAVVKVKQDTIRLAIISYLTYAATTLFKKGCNKSMPRMLAVISLIQLAAEITNRAVTGRPIIPLNEKTLKEYNQKQELKSSKLKNIATVSDKKIKQTPSIEVNKTNKSNKATGNISFSGAYINKFFSKNSIFSKTELQNIMTLTEKINSNLSKRYTKLIEEKLTRDSKNRKLTEIFADNKINDIYIEKNESDFTKVIRSIFIPVVVPAKLIKKLISKQKEKIDEFIEVKNYLEFAKNLLRTKYKNKDLMNDKNNFNDFRKDIMNMALGSFRTTEANYNTAHFAIIKRIFTYAIFISFISADTYNVTLMHSDGDKKKALKQTKQRFVQDLTRFFISVYTASANLAIFEKLYNKTLVNAFGITAIMSTINNYFTRTILGMPVLPSDKAHIEELNTKNKKSSIYKLLNKFIDKDEAVNNNNATHK